MSITDELREWASTKVPYKYGHQISEIADRIDTEHERGMEERADRYSELRAKMNNCYVELPKDADDEYIHIGDVMGHRDFPNAKYTVVGIGEDAFFTRDGAGEIHKHIASIYPHYKPTVEDVLREMLDKWGDMPANMTNEAIVAEYAAKLRLAGGDE